MSFWNAVNRVIYESAIVMMVADARMPDISMNKEIEQKVIESGKNFILVFNKVDLLSPEELKTLRERYPRSFFVAGIKNEGISHLRRSLQIMLKRLGNEFGKVGIVGYPNVGKSAILNALSRGARAKVSSVAGTTKGIQWVRAGNLKILDSPGVIPFDERERTLGILGAKNPEKLKNPERIAMEIIVMAHGKKGYSRKPSEEELANADKILLEYGRKKGYLKKGGEVNMTKTSIDLIRAWNNGKLKL